MRTFNTTASSSLVVSNVFKVTYLIKASWEDEAGIWTAFPCRCSCLEGNNSHIDQVRKLSIPKRIYPIQWFMHTRRASWTGSPNLSKDSRGMEKRVNDWRQMSILRRRPGHAFERPDSVIKTRTAYLQGVCGETKPSGQRNQRDSDLDLSCSFCSKIITTLRNMTRHYSIIESVFKYCYRWPGIYFTQGHLHTW